MWGASVAEEGSGKCCVLLCVVVLHKLMIDAALGWINATIRILMFQAVVDLIVHADGGEGWEMEGATF